MIGIFISTKDRPEYTKRSVKSLVDHFPPGIQYVCIVDDGTKKYDIQDMFEVRELSKLVYHLEVVRNKETEGIDAVIKTFVRKAVERSIDVMYITDNDVIYGNGWMHKIADCYSHFSDTGYNPIVTTGFNTMTHPSIPSTYATLEYIVKDRIGGISWFMSTADAKSIGLGDGPYWDDIGCTRINKMKGIIGSTRLSYIEHIGQHGINSNGKYDKAIHFVERTNK